MLEELEGKDRNSAELFLETVVLQKKASVSQFTRLQGGKINLIRFSQDPSLQARLIDWYLARLESLLTDKRGKIYIASHSKFFSCSS